MHPSLPHLLGSRIILGLTLVACAPGSPQDAAPASPDDVANELLATDRAYSDSGAAQDLVASLSRMLADDVRLIAMGQSVRGREAALGLLRASSANLTARVTWTPIRAAISGDGTHGFTAGYQEVRLRSDSVAHAKYLAYWTRTPLGWRVLVYKRGPRPSGGAGPLAPGLAVP